MSKRALIIVNPVAGKMKIKEELPVVDTLLQAQGYFTKIYFTKAKGDASRAAAKFGKSWDVIVCCGGDGTLNEVIAGLLKIEQKPLLLYYPCGSTNDFATTLGLSNKPEESVWDIDNKEVLELDVGLFNNELNFSYIASFGIFVKASYSAPQKLKNAFGHFAYVLQGIKELPTIGKSYHTKVTYDDGVIEGDFALVAVTNSTSAGGVLRLSSEQVKLNDGLFEILLIKGVKTPADAAVAIKKLLSKEYDGEVVTLLHTTKAVIECDEAPSWCTDGEYAGNLAYVEAECLKGAVRLLI
jgi:YegS/Rv2252/BmrU family lipid kinase